MSPPRIFKSVVPTRVVENENMTKLYRILQQIEQRPNIMTLAQFNQFRPLFCKNHRLTEKQIFDLSGRYCSMIDFYKPTQIIKSATETTVMVTLPALFTPVRTLSTTDHHELLVATNTKMSGSNVPLYSSAAFGNMFKAVVEEQKANAGVVAQYRADYAKTIQAFFDTYHPSAKSADTVANTEVVVDSKPFQEATWEFDE